MSRIYIISAMIFMILAPIAALGQQIFKGKIIDATTKQPIAGASIHCSTGCDCGCATDAAGEFELRPKENCCNRFNVTSVGYQPTTIQWSQPMTVISLQQEGYSLQEVVVTANREGVRRSLAPVAISSISSKMIQDARPVSIDQVLNKVSGVYMVNLGNEQHSMSIRQPMTTKSLFLYLEDGVPIRTTGLFNHNALLELNMAAVKNIEVIKGPSSALYGSEAIGGVVNFITFAPSDIPVAKLSLQGNNIGYKRADLQTGFKKGKWGFGLNGYYASKNNGFIDYTDFKKATLTGRIDYEINKKTSLTGSFSYLDYDSDMWGSIDSSGFANKSFSSRQTFTYRNVQSLRAKTVFNHSWHEHSKSTVTLIYRDNTIGQNPAYAIKDDYRRMQNGNWTGNKALAHGEINEAGFKSYALIFQQRQNLKWKNATLIGGASIDISPSTYSARYISIVKDTVSGKYTGYHEPDSILTQYKSGINNYAGFLNFEASPIEKLRVVASVRYDVFRYDFDNYLTPSAYSGSPDTINVFQRLSPKIGFTYNFSNRVGLYANYSEGFVPPQITEMYKGIKVPELTPSVFYNYEAGGWAEIVKGKLSADISLYRLDGTNEIISVRMDDGSSRNMNTGRTRHMGIELGMKASPVKDVSIRFSSALSKHRFIEFVEKGVSYNQNEMNNAPHWMHNAEIWYTPAFIRGIRLGLEWQKLGSYYMDPLNTVKYEGFDAFNLRVAYKYKSLELWVNMMNATDRYYAYTSSKSNFGYSYTPAEPRHFNMGIAYDFGHLLKKQK